MSHGCGLQLFILADFLRITWHYLILFYSMKNTIEHSWIKNKVYLLQTILGSVHMWLFCVEWLTKKQVLLYASFRVIYVTLVEIQMLGYMFWFLIYFKAAWDATLMVIWKKVAWKAWALLCFFAQAVHTLSVSHSQFDKHLIMPQIPGCIPFLWP